MKGKARPGTQSRHLDKDMAWEGERNNYILPGSIFKASRPNMQGADILMMRGTNTEPRQDSGEEELKILGMNMNSLVQCDSLERVAQELIRAA